MSEKRQVYRLILQLMTYIGIGAILWVLFGSVFVGNSDKATKAAEKIEISLQQLKQGEMTHVLWLGKKVSILHRNDRDTVEPSYFVFFNVGDSGNCPLFFSGAALKDTCTGTLYNQSGEPIGKSRADELDFPPHYFPQKQQLVIGENAPSE